MKIPSVQKEVTDSGWFATMGATAPTEALSQEIDCDHLVIGGGWTGLHCARRLAELEPDAHVVLVDAGRIGNSAAGRCAGFAIDLAHNPRNTHFAEDIQGNTEEYHINMEGIDYIRKAIESHDIDCDWSPEGKYHSAATDKGVAHLKKYAHALDNLNQKYDWVEKEEIQAITGSKHYIKALFAPGTVLFQPAKYMHYAMKALPANVTIYENTAVTEVSYSASTADTETRHMCRTTSGAIRPKKIFLCNAGYLTKFGFFDKTPIPLYTYASLTRPLTDAESAKLGARETFGLIPADSFGTTVRRTADNRLFLRNVYSYARGFKSTQKQLDAARVKHQLAFDRRYPELSDMGYETSWGGMMTISHNGGMIFGKLAANVFGSAFCNGTGVSRGTTFGKALAEYALGKKSRSIDILLSRPTPNKGYPELITEIGVRATTSLRLYQAGREV